MNKAAIIGLPLTLSQNLQCQDRCLYVGVGRGIDSCEAQRNLDRLKKASVE